MESEHCVIVMKRFKALWAYKDLHQFWGNQVLHFILMHIWAPAPRASAGMAASLCFALKPLWYFLGGEGVWRGADRKKMEQEGSDEGGSLLDNRMFKIKLAAVLPLLCRTVVSSHSGSLVLSCCYLYPESETRGWHHEWKNDPVLYLPVTVKIEHWTPPVRPHLKPQELVTASSDI